MLVLFYGLVPGLAMLAVSFVGARGRRLNAPAALGTIAAVCVLAVLLAAVQHDPDVSESDFVEGLALAGLLVGVVPALVYLVLGRLLSRRRGWLVAVWVVSLVPLAYYLLLAELLVASLVACPPDAYECPV